jgi:hypothetical protein
MSTTPDDINFMKSMQNMLDVADSSDPIRSLPSTRTTSIINPALDNTPDIGAMSDILNMFNDAVGDEFTEPLQPTFVQPQMQNYDIPDEGISYEEYLARTQNSPIREVNPITGKPKVQWAVVEENIDNMKQSKKYCVQNTLSKTSIINSLYLRESADILCALFNAGRTLNESDVIMVLSKSLQYTSLVEDMIKNMNNRNKVLKEFNYDAAKKYDSIIIESKNAAKVLKQNFEALTKKFI